MNDKLVKSLKENPVKYARLLGFSLLTDLHNEWIKDMVWQQEDDETLLAHRGSYKTTCVSFALALIIVLKPNKTTIFIRKTDTDVVEIAKQIDKILHSDLFSYIVKEIYGVDLVVTSNSYQIDTNLNTGTKGTPQLICLGIHTSLTGKHSDYIFTDDIVNVQDRTSQAERNSTKIQYQELQNVKNRDGRIFNTCTPWHKQDAISELMPNKKFYDCYSTGLITADKLMALRESMDPSLFAANYELKHIASDKALFGKPNYCNDETLFYEGVSHIDASYGGADWTAYTIMKKEPNGTIDALARRVIAGEFGSGDARKNALGSNYDAVQKRVNEILSGTASAPAKKSVSEIAKEVLAGAWGNGNDRKNRLVAAGYNYDEVQNAVNALCTPKPSLKPMSEIAKEVLAGVWGNGDARKHKLEEAGYNYSEVQTAVNKLCNKKSVTTIAKEVIAGKWGNGADRKKKLESAGYNYNEVQKEVNRLL